jgi:hypothetical protein
MTSVMVSSMPLQQAVAIPAVALPPCDLSSRIRRRRPGPFWSSPVVRKGFPIGTRIDLGYSPGELAYVVRLVPPRYFQLALHAVDEARGALSLDQSSELSVIAVDEPDPTDDNVVDQPSALFLGQPILDLLVGL